MRETATYDATLPWFGTVRGRLGYSVGSTLFYATGGLAYGSIKTKIATNSFVGPVTQSFSHTNTGWTAGAGIETPYTLLGLLGPNWTTKTEYLYVDLGSTSDSFVLRRSDDDNPLGHRTRLSHRHQLPLQFAGRCEVLRDNSNDQEDCQ